MQLDVSGALVWLLVALGLGVVVVRRRSVAVGLVTAQALVLAGAAALPRHRRHGLRRSRLAVRAVALGALLLLVVSRTREPRPVRAGIAPLARGGLAVGFALALTWLVPAIGLDSRNAERGVLALIAFGVTDRRDAPRDALPGARDRALRERARARRARAARAARRPRSSSASPST